jgi:hypothetical protein
MHTNLMFLDEKNCRQKNSKKNEKLKKIKILTQFSLVDLFRSNL